jgi:HD-GYP domain-containing protein (c-di-GMP phosphodiesterase class II)
LEQLQHLSTVTGTEGAGRLAELTIALSLATDLGTGQPMEHGLRSCLLSLAAAEELDLDSATRSCVYYTALLRFLGCTSDAAETAELAGGDEIVFNATFAPVLNAASGEQMRYFLRHLAEELPWHRRAGQIARALADKDGDRRSVAQHCEAACRLADRLGVGADVCEALAHAFERWDGKGQPHGLAGEAVPIAVRIVAVARDVELWARSGGWSTVAEILAHRRGHGYDPAVVDVFLANGGQWLGTLADNPAPHVLDAEPPPVRLVATGELDGVLAAVADFTDLKSPWFRTHSSGVAALVHDAALAAGCFSDDATMLRRAALVHDVGRVGVPNGIWGHRGSLSAAQWERVRMHPYLTERVLHGCAVLAPFAELAGHHHERVDGSGYHRGAAGDDQLSFGVRLLAAADAYHAMTEERPHRPALAGADAAAALSAEVGAGRFTRREVDAVLAAAGLQTRPPNVARPAGLTEREVAVLRLISRGNTNKQVAKKLGISAKTVGHHVEHIYVKTGVSTRAGATLFAMEHGLLTI